MNRFLFAFVTVFTLLSVCKDAEACNRCGLFGNRCRYYYQPYYYQPVAYYPPTTQTLVFNNSYPISPLQGSTVYGVSLPAQSYSFDPALYQDRAARFTELSLQNSRAATDGFNNAALAQMALADAQDRRTKNFVLAMAAMDSSRASAPTAQASSESLTLTIRDGQVLLNGQPISGQPEKGGSQSPAQAPRSGLTPLQNPNVWVPSLTMVCGKCHDGVAGPKKPPATTVINDATKMSSAFVDVSIAKVASGEMPPGSTYSDQQKAQIIAKLNALRVSDY